MLQSVRRIPLQFSDIFLDSKIILDGIHFGKEKIKKKQMRQMNTCPHAWIRVVHFDDSGSTPEIMGRVLRQRVNKQLFGIWGILAVNLRPAPSSPDRTSIHHPAQTNKIYKILNIIVIHILFSFDICEMQIAAIAKKLPIYFDEFRTKQLSNQPVPRKIWPWHSPFKKYTPTPPGPKKGEGGEDLTNP